MLAAVRRLPTDHRVEECSGGMPATLQGLLQSALWAHVVGVVVGVFVEVKVVQQHG